MNTVNIDDIKIPSHRKTRGNIEQLTNSIRDLGLLNPITLTTSYRLIAGYHRYLACKSLGWQDIPANIVTLDALHAELAEIDENLQRQELTVLERAEQLARRKNIYEEVYPQTKHGGDRKSDEAKNQVAESATWSFNKDTAAKTGISERAVRVNFQIANDIAPAVKDIIRDTDLADRKTDLLSISRLSPDHQMQVAQKILSGVNTVSEARRQVLVETAPPPPQMPSNKYRVIYADPPWSYGNTQPDYFTEQRDHYMTMPLPDICNMPIKALAEDNAVLFMWVTSPMLEESFQVVSAWGFKYKSSFVWDKILHNMGHYNSVRHEMLLVCTRGSCQPDIRKLFDSVYSEERTQHSKKPEHFRSVIDTIYPNGRRIELFARNVTARGWDVYGNQA